LTRTGSCEFVEEGGGHRWHVANPAEIAKFRKLDVKRLPIVKGRARLGPCFTIPSKFVALA